MRSWGIKLVILIGLLAIGRVAVALPSFDSNGNPLDTPATTEVTAEAADCTVGYEDLNNSLMPTEEVAGGGISYTTKVEVGFSSNLVAQGKTAIPGDLVTFESIAATNEGNVGDSYRVSSKLEYANGADEDFIAKIYDEDTSTYSDTLTVDAVSVVNYGVGEDDDQLFHYEVAIPTDAPNGAGVTIRVTLETDSRPGGQQYAGGNGLDYGGIVVRRAGWPDEFPGISVLVWAPEMKITRSFVVDVPDEYEGRQGAGSDHRIPGAVITFTYTISNEGGSTAESVVLIDRIPTAEGTSGTNLAHIDAAPTIHNGVDLSHGGQSTATGWNVYYSTVDNPSMTYGDYTGWTTVGAVDGTQRPSNTTLYDYNDTEFTAKWIKFENPSIDGNDVNKTLVWGVTIR